MLKRAFSLQDHYSEYEPNLDHGEEFAVNEENVDHET